MKTVLFTLAMVSILFFSPARVVGEEEGQEGRESLESPSNKTFRVNLIVLGFHDEATSSQITRDINSELRSLGDVIIAESEIDYQIRVFQLPNLSEEGKLFGFTLVWYATSITDQNDIYLLLRSCPSLEKIERAKIIEMTDCIFPSPSALYFENTVTAAAHTCPQEGLHDTCKKIVAIFETDVLEGARRHHQKVIDDAKHRTGQGEAP